MLDPVAGTSRTLPWTSVSLPSTQRDAPWSVGHQAAADPSIGRRVAYSEVAVRHDGARLHAPAGWCRPLARLTPAATRP